MARGRQRSKGDRAKPVATRVRLNAPFAQLGQRLRSAPRPVPPPAARRVAASAPAVPDEGTLFVHAMDGVVRLGDDHRLDVYLVGGEVVDVRLDGQTVWPTWFKIEWKGTGDVSAKVRGVRLSTRQGDEIKIHEGRP